MTAKPQSGVVRRSGKKIVRWAFGVLTICLLLSPPRGHGATAVIPSLTELVESVPTIITGRVTKVASHYYALDEQERAGFPRGRDKTILTKISLNVERTFKGSAAGRIVLVQEGGCVVNECLNNTLHAPFKVGDRAIFFLVKGRSGGFWSFMGRYGEYRLDEAGNISSMGAPYSEVAKRIERILQKE